MEKSEKNERKDINKTIGKIWIDEHTPYEKRSTGSGLVFAGKYVDERKWLIECQKLYRFMPW